MPTNLIGRRAVLGAAAALAPVLAAPRARAADTKPLRIGILTDETGPYTDSGGRGSVLAARMAIADEGAQGVEILHADTQNKPDVAASVARQWYDSGVDMVTDLPVTSIASAVQQVAKEKQRTVIITAAASTFLTARDCNPYSSHWADDTHALSVGPTSQVLRAGGRKWYFITVDYVFGTAMEKAASAVITAGGGQVLGAARYPLGTQDYSSMLVQAQSSGADVVGLASVGNDLVNLVKQAGEFGISAHQRLVGFLIYITEVHALGLKAAQGFTFASSFYWDQNDTARAFSQRFLKEHGGMPTRNHAAIYAACRHFIRAAATAGTRDALAIGRAMRAMPVDYLGVPATLRVDGRLIYDLALWRVKTPAESHGAWDYYTRLATIPAAEAFLPITPACKG